LETFGNLQNLFAGFCKALFFSEHNEYKREKKSTLNGEEKRGQVSSFLFDSDLEKYDRQYSLNDGNIVWPNRKGRN
jgi:hypothetical protein